MHTRQIKNRRITDLDRERFMYGDCHVLAQAIHDITGWPIHTFFEEDYPSIHAFVVTPKNTALDVNGEQKMSEFRSFWKKFTYGSTRHAKLENHTEELDQWGLNFGTYSHRRAKQLAPYLVEQVKHGRRSS